MKKDSNKNIAMYSGRAISDESPVCKKAIELLKLKSGDVLLDAGCGAGNLLVLAERKKVKVDLHGIDISETNIRIAKGRLKKTKLKVGNITKLPYKSKKFNKIAIIGVLLYLTEEELEKAVEETNRVSSQNAVIVIRNNQPLNYIGNRIKLILSMLKGKKITFTDRYYHPNKIISLFEKKGFKLTRFEITAEKKIIDCNPILRKIFGSAWYIFRKGD